MKIIEQDILSVKSGIICHQVNCQGVMGTGIALSIKQKWLEVYKQYRDKLLMPRYKNLGRAQIISIGQNLYCCNLFGQFDFGRDYRRTEYGSIYTALKTLQSYLKKSEKFQEYEANYLPLYFPYKMSCNNAGGDWNLIMEMLDELFPDCNICKIN